MAIEFLPITQNHICIGFNKVNDFAHIVQNVEDYTWTLIIPIGNDETFESTHPTYLGAKAEFYIWLYDIVDNALIERLTLTLHVQGELK